MKNAVELYKENGVAASNMTAAMMFMTPENRYQEIRKVGEYIAETYPTMANQDNYLANVPDEKKLEDFSIDNRGEVIDERHDIVRTGRASADYHIRVQKVAEWNHWRAFWYIYGEYEQRGGLFPDSVPDFYYHIPHIKMYTFQCLQFPDAMRYITMLLVKLVSNEGLIVNEIDDEEIRKYQKKHYEDVKKQLKDIQETLRTIGE